MLVRTGLWNDQVTGVAEHAAVEDGQQEKASLDWRLRCSCHFAVNYCLNINSMHKPLIQ
jgi:hypothetical protein